jgi:aspartyl-tRNA(Asn)/glutamyl-tRNA(Gln) amidotransferase subunit A
LEYHELSVAEAAKQIRSGEISPVELAGALLLRAEELDPTLHAWVSLDRKSVLTQAERSLKQLQDGSPTGILHGVPIGLKDIFYTAGTKTTACSSRYADFVPNYDATCVSRLKDAGAIMMGKLVTTPYAASDPSPTLNPWDTKRTPGGSSSGSAVAVSTGMCPAALGSQTVGSTLRPAAYAGIVGLKPTFGMVSLHGVIPLGRTLDTVGVLTRTVRDAELLLMAMSGYDPRDPVSAFTSFQFAERLSYQDFSPRIGLVEEFFFQHSDRETKNHITAVADKLSDAGAQITRNLLSETELEELHHATTTTFEVDVAAEHGPHYLADASLYPPQIAKIIERGLQTPAHAYANAQRTRVILRQRLRECFESVDVLLSPSTPGQAPLSATGTTGPPIFQGPWTSSGIPAISIPSGLDSSNLPIGTQLAGPMFGERKLITVAGWCEWTLDQQLVIQT